MRNNGRRRRRLRLRLKDLKEHDSTLFQSSGLALKQGEKFFHSLDVKQIKCVEAKLTKVGQDMESLENKKRSYDSIFRQRKQHINIKVKEKNGRKSNE